MDVLLERLGLGGAHHPLDRPHRQRGVGGDLAGHLARPLRQLAGRDDLVDETEFEGLVGSERPPRERDLGGLRVADDPRQQPRATALGEDATLGESGIELGAVGGDADVAPEREIEAVARGSTVQRAHGRCVDVVQDDRRRVAQLELAGERLRPTEVPQPTLRTGHLGLEIETGAERPTLAREHDAPRRRIAIRLEQPGRDLLQHDTGDRVHPLRSVERDGGDVVGHVVEHFGHGRTLHLSSSAQ